MKHAMIVTALLCSLFLPSRAGSSAEDVAQWKRAGDRFSIGAIRPQRGWVAEEQIAPIQWQAAEQTDLSEQMEDAPQLELENVAPPPERCWVGHHLVWPKYSADAKRPRNAVL